jgi:hypothetical protein
MRAVERRQGVLLSSTHGKINNATYFIHLWLLTLWGFRYLLAIVSPYNLWTGGPVRAHSRPYELTIDPGIRTPHSLCNQVTSQASTFTQYSHCTVLPPCSLNLNLKDTVSPQKGCYFSFWGATPKKRVDQTPHLPPEADLNLNLGSYQSDEWGSQVGSQVFPGSLVQQKLTSLARQERVSLPWINLVQWRLAGVALTAGQGF